MPQGWHILQYFTISSKALYRFFGWSDESLSLFGFGIDSFIESLSATGIIVMLHRIRHNEASFRPVLRKLRYGSRLS
ncbi:MAG: hypothetical protein ACP5PS_03425, partial [Bacteroidales bacterium]